MDNNYPENKDTAALLREIAATQRQNARITRIAAVSVIVLAAVLLVSLVLIVPKLTGTLNQAHAALNGTQQTIQRINASLDTLDGLGENLKSFSDESTETLNKLLNTLNTVDLDALTRSIQSFNSVLEGLSNFRLFG